MSWKSLQQYKFSVAATSSAAFELAVAATARSNGLNPQVRIYSTVGVVFIFGSSGVAAADATENGTTKALPDGMVQQAAGAIETHQLDATETHIRFISDDEASTGVMWVDVGHEVGV